MVAATAQHPDSPAATTPLPHSPLPTLSPADSHLFNLFAQSDLDLAALALATEKPLTELIPWAASPIIAAWAAAWAALTEQSHRLRSAAAIQSAVNSLAKLLQTTTDPIETRRAAAAIIRAATPPRPRPYPHPASDVCHGRASRPWTAPPNDKSVHPPAHPRTAPLPAITGTAHPPEPTTRATPHPKPQTPTPNPAPRVPSLSPDLAALLEAPPLTFDLLADFPRPRESPAARLTRAAGRRGPAP